MRPDLPRSLASAWLLSAAVAAVALPAARALAPPDRPGEPVDEYAQVMRVHLPWTLFCVAMAFAAGVYLRDQPRARWRAAGGLPAPLAATALGAVLGVPTFGTAVGVGLHLIEALLAVVLGLSLATALADRQDRGARRRRPAARRSGR
ncbi:hypothetical protein [Actinomadura parmotrematis]|uniref:Integral membrane protein n=1 Tax=Actinomadura parmotrematis TaxID=2864039 RepID=A0ABS7FZE6_9ACTN|nr:hypothetical protein [Actinomadura parmotrematis]MBW8484947.1 hypothetical protein [Actinomadura parmotrematis]